MLHSSNVMVCMCVHVCACVWMCMDVWCFAGVEDVKVGGGVNIIYYSILGPI